MKTNFKGILLGILLLPFLGNAQSISSNLQYINNQFDKYNAYETSFSVNLASKELICEDKFGILKANFADVKIDYEKKNIGIYCLNNDKCIRYYGKNGTRKPDNDYNNYTMGLRINDEMIPHIDDVIDKFDELKTLVLSDNSPIDINANLRYINQQFELYNGYNTIFKIDDSRAELICEDKFGVLKAKWSDIEIRTENENIGIFCLTEGKCIRYYDKEGNRKYDEDYSRYTMGLRENEKIIPHINTVLDKFAEIKIAILNGNSYGNTNGIKGQIDTELSKINAIFRRSSEYRNTYYVDYDKNAIISKTAKCRAIIPVKSGLSVNYYKKNGGDYAYGFYFQNSDNSILESCTSFEEYTEKTYEYLSNYNEVQTTIKSLQKIINLLGKNSNNYSFVSPTTISGKLHYINVQFSNYNAHNTVWSIDHRKDKLIWENNYGINSAYFRDITIRANYENGWIGVHCLSGDKCITQMSKNGSTLYLEQYTMSLKENGKMIKHMKDVINEFAAIKKSVLGDSNHSKPSGGSDDTPDK